MGMVIRFQDHQSERERLDSGHRMYGRWRAGYYRWMTASVDKPRYQAERQAAEKRKREEARQDEQTVE